MLKPCAVLAPALIAPTAAQARDVLVVSHHRSALSGGDLFVRVEGKGAAVSEAANPASLICRPDGLAGVFDNRETMALGYGVDPTNIARPSEHVNRQDGA